LQVSKTARQCEVCCPLTTSCGSLGLVASGHGAVLPPEARRYT